MKTKTITQMAVLAALSILLVALIHFPLFPAASFLEYDPADIPILIGGFMFGPGLGLVLTAIVSILQGVTVSSASGIIGILMHFVATGSYVLVSATIYKKWHTIKGAVAALIFGSLAMTVMMVLWNLIMTPIFMGTPVSTVLGMIVPIIIPFNLLKACINGCVTFLVYKPLSKALGFEAFTKEKVA